MIKLNNIENLDDFCLYASKLFKETYTGLLSNEQIDYMINMFFKTNNIAEQINTGYNFEYILKNNQIAGFIAYIIKPDNLYLSKLYLDSSFKNQGIASSVFDYLKKYKKNVRLNVNKYNNHALHVYKKNNFEIISSEINDIGNNYIMDDYVMELKI